MEVKKICSAVGLEDVTKKYLSREKVKEYIEYFDMKWEISVSVICHKYTYL